MRINSLVRYAFFLVVVHSFFGSLSAADTPQAARGRESASAAPQRAPAKVSAEIIGRVLGKPVYRRQIESGSRFEESLHRLFYQPILEKYVDQHPELEPTQAELDSVEHFLERESREKPARDLAKLMAELERVNDQLRVPGLSEKKQDALDLRRQSIERASDETQEAVSANVAATRSIATELLDELKEVRSELGKNQVGGEEAKSFRDTEHALQQRLQQQTHPYRLVAALILSNWKVEKHIYDHYGGGRVLWQQFGLEAIDAERKLLEVAERRGDLQITDSKAREEFFHYWKRPHGLFLDDASLRTQFLEPEWRKRTEQPHPGPKSGH